MAYSKEDTAKHKADFALHVSLIMKRDSVSRTNAIWMAWASGPSGLTRLLGKLAPADAE